MPSLRALQCLVALADQRSVTAAAGALGITQPALSHQLTALESQLGIALFDRGGRGTALTSAGRALLPLARSCTDAELDFTALATRVAGLTAGEVRICCAQSATTGLLPGVLRRWHRRRPDVSFLITESDSADRVAEGVGSGRADLGVCPRPTSWAGTVDVLGWEEVVVVTSTDDPLSGRGDVRLADLAQRPMVHYDPGHGLAGWVDATLAAAGLTARATVRTGQTQAAAVLAATGIGPALVPLSAVPPRFPGAVLRLSPPQGRDMVVLTGPTPDPLAAAFAAELVAQGVPVMRDARAAPTK